MVDGKNAMHQQSGWKLFTGMGRAIALCVGISVGAGVDALMPVPACSAETIHFVVGGPLAVSLPIEALETFAETGEITLELRQYAQFASEEQLATLRQLLQRRFPLDGVTVSNLAYSPLGRDAITQVGAFIRINSEVNGFYGLRAAVINAAVNNTNAAGWTLIDAFRAFPTSTIEVDVERLLAEWRYIRHYLDYNRDMVTAIQTVADRTANQEEVAVAELVDLSQPGAITFQKTTLTVTNPALAQSAQGLAVNYSYDVDAYIPQGLTQPAPLVIISHGFGALKDNFVFLAEHLASHGFAVFIPDHVGSDLAYRQSYLQGQLTTLLSPIEFIARPQEISLLIDTLEQLVATDAQWAATLNLDQIGMVGDSFGSTTVFSLAGAEFNADRLADQCRQPHRLLNFAMYLQCRAQMLPNTRYDLRDDRIKVAIAAHNLGYGLFGPAEVAAIQIPMLMVSGSNDVVAPVVTEQFYPFMWLQTPVKYLALLTPGTHFSSKPDNAQGASAFPAVLRGQHAEYGQQYYKTLALAFLNTHLRGDATYQPYLTATYGNAISAANPMTLHLIQALTPEDITAAAGDRPWIAIEQPPAIAAISEAPTSILAEIAASHVLRVALRRDAPPFGFRTAEGRWDGYCVEFVDALRSHLEQRLRSDVAIELVELPSTLATRFDLVRDGDVHLECGPNTMLPVDGIAFSRPIFAAATRFLIPANPTEPIDFNNPTTSLAGVTLGVLPGTTTATFLAERYPEANITYFDGVDGRVQGIQAVLNGAIAAFAGDDILTLAEAAQLNLPATDYRLVPNLPLTCEFYGILLPDADLEWQRTVNQFIDHLTQRQTLNRWFQPLATTEFSDLQSCLNR